MVKLIPNNFSEDICEKYPSACENVVTAMKEFGMFMDLSKLWESWYWLEIQGDKDYADALYSAMTFLEEIIANTVYELTNGEKIIAFDFRVGKWRDMLSGRFVTDPSKMFVELWNIPIEEYYE